MCVIARSLKVPYEGAKLHKRIPAREPCVIEVLCNWAIIPQVIKVCVCVLSINLGPTLLLQGGGGSSAIWDRG